ncbi:MAG: hypothetical protein Q9227_005863 [Pyrenula ochraceoflavens]
MSAGQFYEIYRGSSIGAALIDTVDDLINEGLIEPQLAMKVLNNFDRAIAQELASNTKLDKLNFKASLGGRLLFCDEVWTFLIKDVHFKVNNNSETFDADKVKIVACNSKKPGEP